RPVRRRLAHDDARTLPRCGRYVHEVRLQRLSPQALDGDLVGRADDVRNLHLVRLAIRRLRGPRAVEEPDRPSAATDAVVELELAAAQENVLRRRVLRGCGRKRLRWVMLVAERSPSEDLPDLGGEGAAGDRVAVELGQHRPK